MIFFLKSSRQINSKGLVILILDFQTHPRLVPFNKSKVLNEKGKISLDYSTSLI